MRSTISVFVSIQLCFMLTIFDSQAQGLGPEWDQYLPPSPNATSLVTFTESPVSHILTDLSVSV